MKNTFIYIILLIILFSSIAQAELSAPTINRAGARTWGTYYDLMGEIGISNGTLRLIYNITDNNGNYYLKNSTFFCGINTTCTYYANGSISIASTGGTGGGVTMDEVNVSGQFQSSKQVTGLNDSLDGKEPTISSSTANKFWGWDKTFKDLTAAYITDFPSAVNTTVDKNLSNWTNTPGYVTNTTVDKNLSNFTNTPGYVTNTTMDRNLSNGTGLVYDANLASTFVKTVGATSPCTSTGGQNPSITCSGLVTNETVNPYSFNANNATGVLPNASMPANVSYNNSVRGLFYGRNTSTGLANLVQNTYYKQLFAAGFQTNPSNEYSNVTGNYTVPFTGIYSVRASLQFNEAAAGEGYYLAIFVNGVVYDFEPFVYSTPADYNSVRYDGLLNLNSGDTIELYAKSNGASNTVNLNVATLTIQSTRY